MPMSTAAMSSPSKIPLPKSRMAPSSASAAASAEDLSSATSPAHLVSRIPKAVSPERTCPPPPQQQQHHHLYATAKSGTDDKENDLFLRHNNGWDSSKPRANLDGSATFVRRPSPPRSALPSEGSDAAAAGNPEVEIDERVLEKKLREARESASPPKNSSGRRSSTTSVGSTGSGSRIPIMAGGNAGQNRHSPATAAQRKYSPPQPQPPSVDPELPVREPMHLDLNVSTSSKIPLPSRTAAKRSPNGKTPNASSPSKLPVVGFSLSPERMKIPKSSSASSSPLKMISSHSTSNLPVGEARGDKKFAAFVMTGDRIINLAKTPANNDFKHKYNKSISESNILQKRGWGTAAISSAVSLAEEESFEIEGKCSDGETSNGLVSGRREQPVARRHLMRTSKSEDTLLPAAEAMGEGDFEEDNAGSVLTLIHDTSGITPLDVSATPSPRKGPPPPPPTSRGPSNGSPTKRFSPEEASSMTSSFMSCSSEHYKAVESVLDNRISPDTSSTSPDTPEWSLTDSLQKKNNGHATAPDPQSPDESITSRGNKVIISIGDSNRNGLPAGSERKSSTSSLRSPTSRSSGSSSNGTVTPEGAAAAHPVYENSPASAAVSSEEDSDMESLHSYHPPAKVIDVPSAVRLAKRLYHLDGFKKTDVSRHLSKNTDYNRVVADEYLKYFDLVDSRIDGALRQFLESFCLTGETQERERVLFHFSRRYISCNPGTEGTVFASPDAVHTLTCAIMLLNTDLHGQTLQRKMTCQEFVDNLGGLNEGADFPPNLLKAVYASIKETAIPWSGTFGEELMVSNLDQQQQQQPHHLRAQLDQEPDYDEPYHGGEASAALPPKEATASTSQPPKELAASSFEIGGAAGGVNPFLTLPSGAEQAADVKSGYVMRKSCFDAQGKKTKMGKRSWRMNFVTLREMVLFCFKDEKSLRSRGAFEDPSNAIR